MFPALISNLLFMVNFSERSPESVNKTIKELEENLEQVLIPSGGSSRKKLARAKVVGTASDVSIPTDVQKLADYAVKELGSIDIWVRNVASIFLYFQEISGDFSSSAVSRF